MRLLKPVNFGMRTAILFATVLSLTVSSALAASARRKDVLVVPARYRTVQIGFDIHALRNPALISYETPAQGGLVHIWQPQSATWRRLLKQDVEFGQYMSYDVGQVIVIGVPEELPEVLAGRFISDHAILWIESLSSADIFNTLNQRYQFTPSEWRALANRYKLKIKDVNEQRRRWGRFGPPGTRIEPPPVQPRTSTKQPKAATPPEPIEIMETTPPPAVETEIPASIPSEPETESVETPPTDDKDELFSYLLDYEAKEEPVIPEERQTDNDMIQEKGIPANHMTPLQTPTEMIATETKGEGSSLGTSELILDLEPELQSPEYK